MPRPKGPGVPAHLLVESESERLSYFRQYVIAHPRLKQVDAALSRAIREPAGAALIFVYGPTAGMATTRSFSSHFVEELIFSAYRCLGIVGEKCNSKSIGTRVLACIP